MFLAGRHRELWDDLFKATYLPIREAIPQLAAASTRIQAARPGTLLPFTALVPSLESVMKNQLKIERRIAALRVIEAIRQHSASHGGKLPESLEEITEVPVPEDPATGEPFIYRAADDAALLHGPRAEPAAPVAVVPDHDPALRPRAAAPIAWRGWERPCRPPPRHHKHSGPVRLP